MINRLLVLETWTDLKNDILNLKNGYIASEKENHELQMTAIRVRSEIKSKVTKLLNCALQNINTDRGLAISFIGKVFSEVFSNW